MEIRTSIFYQLFALLSRSFIIFTALFMLVYGTSFWFKYNASHFGLLAILFSLFLTHLLLKILESNLVTKLFSPLLKGKPVLVYQRWLTIKDNMLLFGNYRLLFQAIDGIEINKFGTLVFTSSSLSGPPSGPVLKVPFAVISPQKQKEFIALLKEKCPNLKLNQALIALNDKPILKSAVYIHILGLFVLFMVLMDIGYSTFNYVELLKRYYLSNKFALAGNLTEAQKEYDIAEQLRKRPYNFSLVTAKLLNTSSTASMLHEYRSEALWSLDLKKEALVAEEEAVKYNPVSFKIRLRLTRLYAALGQKENAQKSIQTLIDKHKYSLLPRLYLASLLWQTNKEKEAKLSLQDYLNLLDKEYFSEPPTWPYSGDELIQEVFYRNDLKFLFSKDRL